MMHPDTELRFVSPEIGFGVYATGFIPAGTITYVQDSLDISIDAGQYAALGPLQKQTVDRYAFIDPDGNRVLCWDHAKYVNHCCHANTISTGYGFEIAIRDIMAGEQVTDDYGLFNLPFAMDVICTKTDCRKTISGKDIARYYSGWDARIIESLKFVDKVPQALLPYLDQKARENVFSYIAGKSEYISVLQTQYHSEACL
jgi:uncharacterized protein